MDQLTWFDTVAFGIILLSAIMALARGLLREVFSIVAFIGAGFAAAYGHPLLSSLFSTWIEVPLLAAVAAVVAIFVAVFVLITALTSVVAKTIHSSSEIGALDRGAGFLFGVLRGFLILVFFVLLVRQVFGAPQAPLPAVLSQARLWPVLETAAVQLEAFIPHASSYIKEGPDAAAAGPAEEE